MTDSPFLSQTRLLADVLIDDAVECSRRARECRQFASECRAARQFYDVRSAEREARMYERRVRSIADNFAAEEQA